MVQVSFAEDLLTNKNFLVLYRRVMMMQNNFTWQMGLFLRKLLRITTNALNHRTVFYFEKVWKKDTKFFKHHLHPKKLLLTLSIRFCNSIRQTSEAAATATTTSSFHHLVIVEKGFYSDLKNSLLHVRSMSTYYACLNDSRDSTVFSLLTFFWRLQIFENMMIEWQYFMTRAYTTLNICDFKQQIKDWKCGTNWTT